MGMDIRQAMEDINKLQQLVVITDPIELSDIPFWKYAPNQKWVPNTVATWINDWRLLTYTIEAGLREQSYDVHMQLPIKNADVNIAADIATAIWVAFLDILVVNIVTTNIKRFDVAESRLAALTFSQVPYVGLDIHLHIWLADFVETSGGNI